MNSVPDSIFKIKDSEILSYIKKNKDKYEIEESKEIEYIYIPDVASELDINNIISNLEQLRDGFNQLIESQILLNMLKVSKLKIILNLLIFTLKLVGTQFINKTRAIK